MIIVRPFNAFGPYQSPRAVIAEIVLLCLAGKPVICTEGKQTREFNYVENLVDGFVLAAKKEEALGRVFNLGCGYEISIRDLIERIHEETESTSELRIGAMPYRPTEIWRMVSDNNVARTLLGWEPHVSFDEGLRRTVAWYGRFRREFEDSMSSLRSLSAFTHEST